MSKRAISVSSELHLVFRALDGIKILTQQWTEQHFTEVDQSRVAHAMHAMLTVLRERLKLLDRMVRGTADPQLLLSDENRAFEPSFLPGEDDDLRLPVWSDRKLAEKLRKDAERAETRLRLLEERRKKKGEREQ